MVYAPGDGWWAPKGFTPDGRTLAPIGRRLGGMLLDGLVVAVPSLVLLVVALVAIIGSAASDNESTGAPGVGLFLSAYAVIFLINIGYFFVEAELLYRRGATWGMGWLDLKVIDTKTGGPISRGKAYGRTAFARFISGQLFGFGYWYALMDDRRRTAHDLVCGTVVVAAS